MTISAVPRMANSTASHVPARLPSCCWHGPWKGHGASVTSRRSSHVPRKAPRQTAQASLSNGTEAAVEETNPNCAPREGASTDLSIIWARLVKVSLQLHSKPECRVESQMRSSGRAICSLVCRTGKIQRKARRLDGRWLGSWLSLWGRQVSGRILCVAATPCTCL